MFEWPKFFDDAANAKEAQITDVFLRSTLEKVGKKPVYSRTSVGAPADIPLPGNVKYESVATLYPFFLKLTLWIQHLGDILACFRNLPAYFCLIRGGKMSTRRRTQRLKFIYIPFFFFDIIQVPKNQGCIDSSWGRRHPKS